MPDKNCSPYLVKFGYGYMGEALTPVMEDYPKFINTQIDTTWRRFEILFADMKQDRTNPGKPVAGQQAGGRRRSPAWRSRSTPTTAPTRRRPTNWEMWLDDVSFIK